MTCIVALMEQGQVWMGADSWTGFNEEGCPKVNPKFFRHMDMLIGCCGEDRVIQVINYLFDSPTRAFNSTIDYLIRQWIPALQPLLNQHEVKSTEWCLLVAAKDGIFFIGSNWSVAQFDYCYAMGSGELPARGALYALRDVQAMSSSHKLKIALESSAFNTPNVAAPFVIKQL